MTCDQCKRDMLTAKGCIESFIEVEGGEILRSIRYGDEERFGAIMPTDKRCHDCHCVMGEYHHPGCDMEECPKCHHQLIGCGCQEPRHESTSGLHF